MKMIYDVGHQSYVHKILTGRADKFDKLRQTDGISGFQKRSESPHDPFEAGHSSTSIAGALGFAYARDLDKKKKELFQDYYALLPSDHLHRQKRSYRHNR